MTDIHLDHVEKRFGADVTAVHPLDLTIADGEFLTLLGPSGCGKTTILRMIAGLETVTAGQIRFGDQRIDTLSPGARNVAMVFQNYALYPHLTVRGNLEYPLKKRSVARGQRAGLVQATARMLQIEELLDRRPRQLSGGQQQRVALGRAMIRDPAAFLFDEPLSNLDAQLRAVMRAELIRLHARLGKTMIYVTHDQLEAMTMSTRIAVMFKGRLQQIGTPGEIYAAPANRFVAGFVGIPAMNFIAGDSVLLPRADPAVVVGVRPEHVIIGQGDLDATVSVVEALGHETIVLLMAAGTEIAARAPADFRLAPGTAVKFSILHDQVHCFGALDGRRIARSQT